MRQKYIITRKGTGDHLKIREYAVLDKDLKNVQSAMLREEHFALLCEENYDGKAVTRSISKGMVALIATLRTRNLFPIQPYATRIAETVMSLYAASGDGSVELFFDDLDLFQTEGEAAGTG